MDVTVRVHEDFDLGGGVALTQGIHDIPFTALSDYQPVIADGRMFFALKTKDIDAFNQQVNEQIYNLYMSDLEHASPLTTKGDLYGFNTDQARIPVGANDTVLVADSAQALGLKWAALIASQIPSLDASKITSGVFGHARLGSGGGGSTKFLREDSTWQTAPTTAPAGSNQQVQYNNSGAFGASANFVYNGSNIVIGTTLTLGPVDASTGGWLRHDGNNMVLSAKAGDIYYGYDGRNDIKHHFYAGTPPAEVIAFDSFGISALGSAVLKKVGSGTFIDYTNGVDMNLILSITAPGAGDKYALLTSAVSQRMALGANGAEVISAYPGGLVGVNTGSTTPSAALHIIKTTEQFRRGYSGSVYYGETIDANGVRTIEGVGSSPKTINNDPVEFANNNHVSITTNGYGLLMRSPDGTQWVVTIDNSGNIVTDSI